MSGSQYLRQAVLKITKDKPVQERANALNLLEMIIEGEFDVDEMVERIANGEVPVRYVPKLEGD